MVARSIATRADLAEANWLATVAALARERPIVRAVIVYAEGAAPDSVGASLIVSAEACSGGVTEPALSAEIVAIARAILLAHEAADAKAYWHREVHELALGVASCACCRTFAWVLFERYAAAEAAWLDGLLAERQDDRVLIRALMAGVPPENAAADLTDFARLIDGAGDTPARFTELL